MKNFIKSIKIKDKKITAFIEKNELSKLGKIYADLEEEHQAIRKNLSDVNYLLDLIEQHELKAVESDIEREKVRKNWLRKIKSAIEIFHLSNDKNLTPADIEFLQKEKSKLLFEKDQLEKEHYHIHQLIAKTKIYVMNVRNKACEEITKGHDIAAVGEKLLEHFGKELKEGTNYNSGRRKIRNFLEKLFSLNQIQAKELVDLLEDSKVIDYKIDYSKVVIVPEYNGFSEFTNLNYAPLLGTWFINA